MKRKLIPIALLLCCTAMIQPVSAAENTIDTAEPIQQDREYAYSFFTNIDDENDDENYGHYYSFTPSSTDEYTVEVKGDWIENDTTVFIRSKSGMEIESGEYNPYIKRLTATAELTEGKTYIIEVDPEYASSTPQVLSTSVRKHVHEYEVEGYNKCKITDYYDGDIDADDGGYTYWCKVCENEEEIEFPLPDKLKLSSSKLTYNGKVQKPKVTITCADGSAFESYQVKYPNSKNPGKYNLTVTFTGDYEGTIKVPYKIIPKAPGAPKLKSQKGGFYATWSKVDGISGYEIQFSNDEDFFWIEYDYSKKNNYSIKNYYIKNVRIYVRVRAYKTVNGKKIVGKWSKAKSVKTK